MQISSSAINLVKNNNKDSTSTKKDWFRTVPKFKKMTGGLIWGTRDWQWQIPGDNEELIGGHCEILGLEGGKCQQPNHRAHLENSQGNR